eukprot:CAMPEP_0117472576 /NCGR_PEP_ID=MMETSP0784-20121206/8321_1 /TAXON_ID=39447 /ORGANISM="" /LENGTH=169 /DNA_ID=CAMNT_0005266737 /DNA_START=89 /DNA_END=600 /DNA_ORIENTATION=+
MSPAASTCNGGQPCAPSCAAFSPLVGKVAELAFDAASASSFVDESAWFAITEDVALGATVGTSGDPSTPENIELPIPGIGMAGGMVATNAVSSTGPMASEASSGSIVLHTLLSASASMSWCILATCCGAFKVASATRTTWTGGALCPTLRMACIVAGPGEALLVSNAPG